MAIWRSKAAISAVGPQFHLKYELLSGNDTYDRQVGAALSMARTWLDSIMRRLEPFALRPSERRRFNYYFRIVGHPTPDEIIAVRHVLNHTVVGLYDRALNVKVSARGGGGAGYVNFYPERIGQDQGYWRRGTDEQGNRGFRGDIHIETTRLATGLRLSAKTLIHEASHRYASTGDFPGGYTADDTGRYIPGLGGVQLDRAAAISNAESFASFVMRSDLDF